MKNEVIHLKEHFSALGENGCDPTVAVYLPYNMRELNRQNQKRPCMIICPGGAYRICSERESEPIALQLLTEGFNVFVITYSTAPHGYPTQLLEVAGLMELIYQNRDIWNCNTEKIAIMGFSAGGHLAAHYTNAYDCEAVRKFFPESKPVNASVLCYPVITADPQYSHKGSFEALLGNSEVSESDIEKFSCDRLVTSQTPPTFMWHTAEDGSVPVMNSILYAKSLSDNKIPFEYHIYPYGYHGLATADIQTNDTVNEKITHIDWLGHLKKWLRLMNFTIQN